MAGFKERSTTSNTYDNVHAYGLFIKTQEAGVNAEFEDCTVRNAKHASRHMNNDLRHLFGRKRGNTNENNMD